MIGRTVYLSAGHSNVVGKDMGAKAQFNGVTIFEGVELVAFVDAVYEELKKLGVSVAMDNHRNILKETLAVLRKKVKPFDVVIEYHFDMGAATGTSTFIPEQATKFEISLAQELSKASNRALTINLRGQNGVWKESQSHVKRLGLMRLNCETVLHEICFLNNESDMNSFFDNMQSAAKAHALAIFNKIQTQKTFVMTNSERVINERERAKIFAAMRKITLDEAKEILADVENLDRNLLLKGHEIRLSGFGTFKSKFIRGRKGMVNGREYASQNRFTTIFKESKKMAKMRLSFLTETR